MRQSLIGIIPTVHSETKQSFDSVLVEQSDGLREETLPYSGIGGLCVCVCPNVKVRACVHTLLKLLCTEVN